MSGVFLENEAIKSQKSLFKLVEELFVLIFVGGKFGNFKWEWTSPFRSKRLPYASLISEFVVSLCKTN